MAPEKICGNAARLGEADAYHLRTVLRLGVGEPIVLFDGTGAEYRGCIRSIDGQEVLVEIVERLAPMGESGLALLVAQGFLKEKKMETLIRPLTELGVTRWLPFMAKRSVATPDAQRLAARKARWHKISLEALKQCRRSRPMTIDDPASFADAIEAAHTYRVKLIFWEESTDFPVSLDLSTSPASVFAMIGPEGGFARCEVEMARDAGFKVVSLGPRILHAETAALTVSALIQHWWGDLCSIKVM